MISKNDLLLLLTELEERGEKVNSQIDSLMNGKNLIDVLKFINQKRPLEIVNFYNVLRKSYNSKKSPLYKNLIKENLEDPNEVLTTLAALNLQILLYSKKLNDEGELFLKHARAEEITRVLNNYYKTYNLIPCIKLFKLLRADIVALEYASGHRTL